MRGFIEVNADLQYDPRLIAVDLIESFCNHEVVTASMSYCVKETYEELKALIEEAQKEDYPKRIVHAGGSINTLPQKERQERMADSLARLTSVSIPHEFFNHEADCDFCEGGSILFALKRGGHADDWFDYSRQLTVEDGIINVAMTREDGTEGENIIFVGISYCPFCGRAFQKNY